MTCAAQQRDLGLFGTIVPYTAEQLVAVGERYSEMHEGRLRWKQKPKGFYRSQYYRDKQVLTFVRDFIRRELVLFAGEWPIGGAVVVVSLVTLLEDVTDANLITSRCWTQVEHEIVEDFFKKGLGKLKKRKKKKATAVLTLTQEELAKLPNGAYVRRRRQRRWPPLVTVIEDGSTPCDVKHTITEATAE